MWVFRSRVVIVYVEHDEESESDTLLVKSIKS